MDPISSTASVLVLVGAAQDAANISLKFLKTIRKAPRGLQALLDEVVRAEAVLMDVKDACQDGQGSTSALNLLLDKARAKLLQLNELIHFKLVKAKAKLEVDRLSFARHQGEVAELKDDLIALRQDITVVLSAASLARTKQIKAHLSEVILAITSMTTEQAFHIGRLPSMALAIQESFPRIEEFQETQQVLTNIRGVICKESATNTAIDDTIPMMTSNGVDDLRSKLQAGYGFSTSMIQSNINMGTGTATTAVYSPERSRSVLREFQDHLPRRQAFQAQAFEHFSQVCPALCRCHCHKKSLLSTPWMVRNLVGKLYITSTGLPFLNAQCTLKTCRQSSKSSMRISYALPVWAANRLSSVWYPSGSFTGSELFYGPTKLQTRMSIILLWQENLRLYSVYMHLGRLLCTM